MTSTATKRLFVAACLAGVTGFCAAREASAAVVIDVGSSAANTVLPSDSGIVARFEVPTANTRNRSARANRNNTLTFTLAGSGTFTLNEIYLQTEAAGANTTHTFRLFDVGEVGSYNLSTPQAASGTLLAEATLAPGVAVGATEGYVVYSFSGDAVTLSSDRVYSVVVNNSNSTGNGAFNWSLRSANDPNTTGYDGGFYFDAANPQDLPTLDAGFAVRATAVVVPEPTTLAPLAAAGLLVLGRRRSR